MLGSPPAGAGVEAAGQRADGRGIAAALQDLPGPQPAGAAQEPNCGGAHAAVLVISPVEGGVQIGWEVAGSKRPELARVPRSTLCGACHGLPQPRFVGAWLTQAGQPARLTQTPPAWLSVGCCSRRRSCRRTWRTWWRRWRRSGGWCRTPTAARATCTCGWRSSPRWALPPRTARGGGWLRSEAKVCAAGRRLGRMAWRGQHGAGSAGQPSAPNKQQQQSAVLWS